MYAQGSCWDRSERGLLFGHTFFSLAETKYTLCALASDTGQPECSCCADLPTGPLERQVFAGELTNGAKNFITKRHMNLLVGCADYQTFWDRRV
jgi:hypothetical protein